MHPGIAYAACSDATMIKAVGRFVCEDVPRQGAHNAVSPLCSSGGACPQGRDVHGKVTFADVSGTRMCGE
jgi:hypothetical protein